MRRERFDKMNVVPFIDIVLVLLVIILATSTFVKNQTIKVDLPTASSKKSEEKKNIQIAVTTAAEFRAIQPGLRRPRYNPAGM